MADDVSIKISVDATDVATAVEGVRTAIASLTVTVQSLQASLSDMAATTKESFASLSDGLSQLPAKAEGGKNKALELFSTLVDGASSVKELGGLLRGMGLATDGAAAALVTGAGAVAAALGVGALAAYQGAEEVKHFNNALIATNGYAGVTYGQVREMAQGIARETHTGMGSAIAVMTQLAASGQFTGDTIRLLGEDAVQMSKLTGQSAEEVAKDYEKMGGGVAKFALDYEKHYHQLTLKQFEYIRELEEAGHKQEAAEAMAKALHEYLGGQAVEKVGLLVAAWRGLRQMIDDAWEAMKGFGREETLDEQASRLKKLIDNLKAGALPGQAPTGKLAQQVEYYQRQLDSVQRAADLHRGILKMLADGVKLQSDAVEASASWKEKLDRIKDGGTALGQALGKINRELKFQITAHPENRALYEGQAAKLRADALKNLQAPSGAMQPKPAKSRMSEWEAEFEQKQAKRSDENPGVIRDRTADEAEFLKEKLALHDLNATELAELNKKYYADVLSLRTADAQSDVATIRSNEQSHAQGVQARLQTTVAGIQEEIKATEGQVNDGQISRAAGLAKIKDLVNQEVEAQRRAAIEIGMARIAADQAIMAHYADNTPEYKAAQQDMIAAAQVAQDAITKATQAGADARKKADDDAAKGWSADQAKAYKNAFNEVEKFYRGIADFSRQNIEGLIKGTESWAQLWNSILDKMMGVFLKWGEDQVVAHFANEAGKTAASSMGAAARTGVAATETTAKTTMSGVEVAHHISGEVAKTAATIWGVTTRLASEAWGFLRSLAMSATSALAQISNFAAVAAAGAYAAIAAIPIVGPLLAPVAAGVALAGVLALGKSLFSAQGGWDDVPYDVALTQLHKNEMVLPASIASPLRDSLAAGKFSTPANQNGANDGGDIHLHIDAMDGASVHRVLTSEHGQRALRAAFDKARAGGVVSREHWS